MPHYDEQRHSLGYIDVGEYDFWIVSESLIIEAMSLISNALLGQLSLDRDKISQVERPVVLD
jgi:hypothetical protein